MTTSQLQQNVRTFHMAELYLFLDTCEMPRPHYIKSISFSLFKSIRTQFSMLRTADGQNKARRILIDDCVEFLLCYKSVHDMITPMLSAKQAMKLGYCIGMQSLKIWNN